MPVSPARLHGITADEVKAGKLKTLWRVADIRSRNIAENIRLASTCSARTGTAEQFQAEIRFRVVIPLNGEFVSDLLDIFRLQTHMSIIAGCRSEEQSFGHGLTRMSQRIQKSVFIHGLTVTSSPPCLDQCRNSLTNQAQCQWS